MSRPTIARTASAETEISRSRFVATEHRIDGLDALAELVRAARRAHPDARHVCSAAVAGPHGEATRSNDDGEPGGTAGAPILSAIGHRALTDRAVRVSLTVDDRRLADTRSLLARLGVPHDSRGGLVLERLPGDA